MAADRLTLTVEEAVARLGIWRALAYELVRQRKTPSLRLGRRRLVILAIGGGIFLFLRSRRSAES
jgi:excisionase family DNA binding protein